MVLDAQAIALYDEMIKYAEKCIEMIRESMRGTGNLQLAKLLLLEQLTLSSIGAGYEEAKYPKQFIEKSEDIAKEMVDEMSLITRPATFEDMER